MRYSDQQAFRDNETQDSLLRIQRSRFTKAPSVNSIKDFTVVLNTGGIIGGATVSFQLVNSIDGISSIRLLRSDTKGVEAADILNTWNVSSGDLTKKFSFVDTSPILALKINYYWLQIVPTQTVAESPAISQTTPLYAVGPQVLNQLKGSQLPPAKIQAFSVSLLAGSNGFQTVNVNWQAPKDPNFGYIRIVVAGFDGQSNIQSVANSESTPFVFAMKQTGQTLTLTAYAVSLQGLVNSTSAPTASITLNGSPTAPASIQSAAAIKNRGGIQIDFDANLEPTVSVYTILRALPAAGFGAASSIGTVTPSAGTNHYSFLDSTAINQEFDYYVTATNPTGTSGASNLASSKGITDNRGNVTFSITDGFSYASTDTSITWSWTGLIIYRSDGTTTAIPDGSQAITGLTASTTYKFFPYWDELLSALKWVIIGSPTGTPAYAYTSITVSLAVVQNQELLSRIALSKGGMSAATTAAAAPPGGGTAPGGGGGGCFTSQVKVKTLAGYIEFGSLPFVVEIMNETGVHTADLIVHKNYEGYAVEIGPDQLVTVDHMMKVSADEWIPAYEFYKKMKPIYFEGTVYNLHIRSTNEADHHYILENGDVAHNVAKLNVF